MKLQTSEINGAGVLVGDDVSGGAAAQREVEPAGRAVETPVVRRLLARRVDDKPVDGGPRHHSGPGGTSGSSCSINLGRDALAVCQRILRWISAELATDVSARNPQHQLEISDHGILGYFVRVSSLTLDAASATISTAFKIAY